MGFPTKDCIKYFFISISYFFSTSMPKDQNYCHTVTKTAEIFEKKHMITLLGIFIIDGPGYFLELSRKLKTDKKTLQERLKTLVTH